MHDNASAFYHQFFYSNKRRLFDLIYVQFMCGNVLVEVNNVEMHLYNVIIICLRYIKLPGGRYFGIWLLRRDCNWSYNY